MFCAGLFAWSLMTAAVFGQQAKDIKPPPASPGKTPVIACDEPEYKFGVVPQGAEVKHVFKIKNKGKGMLKLERAQGG